MNKPLILVVEDDPSVRNLITTTLKTNDYRYVVAPNGSAAIMEATSHNPEIILLDLGLPDMDGVQVIQTVRSWSNVPIIVISARSDPPLHPCDPLRQRHNQPPNPSPHPRLPTLPPGPLTKSPSHPRPAFPLTAPSCISADSSLWHFRWQLPLAFPLASRLTSLPISLLTASYFYIPFTTRLSLPGRESARIPPWLSHM